MIRSAKKEDVASIIYINVTSWKETYKDIFPKSFLDKLNPFDEESIQKCISKINEYIVYTKENQVLGFARYGKNKKDYNDNYGEIYALYVDNNHHGEKIGSKLVKNIIKRMKVNYKYLLVSTLKNNGANEFYKKIGGKIIDECNFVIEGKKYKENIYVFDISK